MRTKALGWLAVCGVLVSPAAAAPLYAPMAPSATAHPERWPRPHRPAAITDPATERRIGAILGRMTLEQKVGQTIQADISSITPADLDRYPLGSILAGGNSGPFGDERASSSQWARLVRAFRERPVRVGDASIPVLFGVDAVHGHSNLPGATIFPHNIGLGAAHDPALIRRIGAATAEEVTASGIEWTFAPTLAVPQDGRWGRAYEGYSSDPSLVAAYARQMVLGLQGPLVRGMPIGPTHVAATAKHFLADGGTAGGKDEGDAQLSEAELIARHALGYPRAIEAGTLTVMVSFSSWNGVKNHGNRSLITGVLKGRMGFGGLVVGDWNAHGQVDGCTVTHCPQALNAGLDMYMAPDSWKGLYENMLADVRAGRISKARLDDAVRRILRVKAKLGLLDGRPVRDTPAVLGSPAHAALAREAVAKSLVLLKNEGRALPIRAGARVLVAGAGANNMAKQAGGWTITWQGSDTSRSDFPNGRTIWEGIRDAVVAAGGRASFSADGQFAERPDVAIVAFGEDPYAEFQGDVPTLDYQSRFPADLALLKRLKASGIPVVSVFLSGRPLFASAAINASDAFVAAWLPGTAGDGVADVLVAGHDGRPQRDFQGRLSYPWPADARSPVVRPLFPLGYGLGYARPGHVPQLGESPGMDLAEAVNADRYFGDGHALKPWTMSLIDQGGARTVTDGATASASGLLTSRPVGIGAQEDSRQLSWTGPAVMSIDGPPVNVTRELTEAFGIRLSIIVDRPPAGRVLLKTGGVALDVTARLKAEGPLELIVPLRCFADKGAAFDHLGNAVAIDSDGPATLTLRAAALVPIGTAIACPPSP